MATVEAPRAGGARMLREALGDHVQPRPPLAQMASRQDKPTRMPYRHCRHLQFANGWMTADGRIASYDPQLPLQLGASTALLTRSWGGMKDQHQWIDPSLRQ
ncbi:hypothetical protein V2G26_011647 [Clonostachys chloroleuca]